MDIRKTESEGEAGWERVWQLDLGWLGLVAGLSADTGGGLSAAGFRRYLGTDIHGCPRAGGCCTRPRSSAAS